MVGLVSLLLHASLRRGGVALADLEALVLASLILVALAVLPGTARAARSANGEGSSGGAPGWGVVLVGILVLVAAFEGVGGPGARGHALVLLLWAGYILGRHQAVDAVGRRVLVVLLAAVGLSHALWGILQSFGWLGSMAHSGVSGGLRNPNHFATLISLSLPFALVLACNKGRGSWRWVGAVGVAMLWLVCLGLSGSRGGVLALAGGLGSLWLVARGVPGALWLGRRHGVLRLGLTLGSATLPGVLVAGLGWRPVGEIFGLERRLLLYGDIVSMVADHPWRGVGLGLFRWCFRGYQSFDLADRYDFAHSEPLEWAAELGIPLALVLFGWLGWRFLGLARRIATAMVPERSLALACCLALATIFCHGSIDFGPRIPLVALLLGLVLALTASLSEDPALWGGVGAMRWAGGGKGRRLLAVALAFALALALALVFWRLGRQRVALAVAGAGEEVAELRSALVWDDALAGLHHRLGSRLSHEPRERNPRQAREHLERAVELNPWSGQYRMTLGKFDQELGRPEIAERSYRAALALAPHSARGQLVLAQFHARRGEWSRATTFGWRAVAEDSRVLHPLAESWLTMGIDPVWLARGWPPRRGDELVALLVGQGGGEALDAGSAALLPPEHLAAIFDRWLELEPRPDPAAANPYLGHLLARGDFGRLDDSWRRLLIARWGAETLPEDFLAGHERVWNGDFERPLAETVLGWRGPSGKEGFGRREGAGPDGSTALELGSGAQRSRGRLRQAVLVVPGETLEFEYARRAMAESGSFCELQIFEPRARHILWGAPPVSGPTGWQRRGGELRVPAGVELLLVRSVREPNDGGPRQGRRCWIDQVSLRSITASDAGVPAAAVLAAAVLKDAGLQSEVN